MPQDHELPPDVIQALKANRKIEAIRLVHEHYELDLMQAKEIVEIAAESLEARPEIPGIQTGIQPMQAETGIKRIVVVIIIGITVYALYTFLG